MSRAFTSESQRWITRMFSGIGLLCLVALNGLTRWWVLMAMIAAVLAWVLWMPKQGSSLHIPNGPGQYIPPVSTTPTPPLPPAIQTGKSSTVQTVPPKALVPPQSPTITAIGRFKIDPASLPEPLPEPWIRSPFSAVPDNPADQPRVRPPRIRLD